MSRPRRFGASLAAIGAALLVSLHAAAEPPDDDPPPVEEAASDASAPPPAPAPDLAAPSEPPADADAAAPIARPGLPDFMRNKRRMRDEDVVDKVEGGYFTGLPLVNSDPDTGFGFGARVLYFNDGKRADEMFAYTPYRHRVYGQAFFTTNGYQYHTIDYDAPYLLDSAVRIRASLVFERNTAANYFGAGEASLGRLTLPGDPRKFSSLADYTDALRQTGPDGTAFTRFNQYILQRPLATVSLQRDFFGGLVRALVGLSGSYVSVEQWSGRTVDAVDGAGADVTARQGQTRLDRDCARSLLRGCSGGFNNTLKLGVAFDTRDFEPDPNSGVFIDLGAELSGRPLGSDFDWGRVTFTPRVYYSPFPKLADLVIAARLVGSVQSDGTPFFSLPELSFTEGNLTGLGGLRTIRGYKQNRFVGQAIALANLEVRWTFWDVTVRRHQHFAFMLAPFIDVGRVFDSLADFELRRFRNGQGAGLRIAWNQATIIVFDFGVSREGSGLYVNFNHPF